MRKNKKQLFGSLLYLSIFTVLISSFGNTVVALSPFIRDNTYVYNPDSVSCSPGETFSDMSAVKLPPETIKTLDSMKVKEKVQKNMPAYKAAEAATGVPEIFMATIHYREAGLSPAHSMANGQRLGIGTSSDGVAIGKTLKQDAVLAARHFIDMAGWVYGVDVRKPGLTTEEIAKAFLAYNRGKLYLNDKLDYTKSGYIMKGIDSDHIGGPWIYLDPFGGHYAPRTYKNNNPGVLAFLAYMGSDVSATNCPGAATAFTGEMSSYGQCDERWGNIKYSGGNFCSSACGVVAAANIITTLKKQQITPKDILENVRKHGGEIKGGGGSHTSAIANMMEKEYGLKKEVVASSDARGWFNKSGLKEKIEKVFEKGGVIYTSGKGGRPYSTGGHVIAIYKKMDNGNWLVADSVGKKGTSAMQATIRDSKFASDPENILKEYKPSEVIAGMHNYAAAFYAQ